MQTPPFGVYVHIPFCAHRCDYCDFATWTDRAHVIDEYVDACVTDIERQFAAGLPPATSVFFGGGTPSLIPPERLVAILDAIPRAADAEVTVECNPESFDAERCATYVAHGVNRVSIGSQSNVAHVLESLGRAHDPGTVARAVRLARDGGIERVNLDIIYGADGESIDDWRATLDGTIALGPDHVSAYGLTVEAGTPLAQRVGAGSLLAPDDDDQAAKYEIADDTLRAAGYEWYEISNWARPGEACRHNLVYWDQGDYLAVGCAAHGSIAGRRHWNVRTPERYIERIAASASPEAGSETLDAAEAAGEAFALALRLRTGAVPLPGTDAEVTDLIEGGLLARSASSGGDPDRLVLTRRGRLLANDVIARLLLGAERAGSTVSSR